MAQGEYNHYFKLMVEQNQKLFSEFEEVLGKYAEPEILSQDEFHDVGRKVVDVVRDWDRRLCSAMGKGQFSKYTELLSEKFWDEVRVIFPLIDQVGVRKK